MVLRTAMVDIEAGVRLRTAVASIALLGFGLFLSCAMVWPTDAHAAEVPSSPEVSADQTSRPVAEIVVTAERREERLQDVPASITALSGADLESMGAESFNDYARSVPGLVFADPGNGRQTLAIRGTFPGAGAATVGYYLGETPMPTRPVSSTNFVNPDLLDIERVEVLRGPQGTLYGSNSIGGTIKLIPNAPNPTRFEGSIKTEALLTHGANGPSPGTETDLVLNLPIVEDVVAWRTAFWYRNVGGYINRRYGYAVGAGGDTLSGLPQGKVNNLPDEHTWGLRSIALFQPSEKFNVSLMAFVQNQRFDGFTDITGGASNPGDRLVQDLIADVPEPQENRFGLYNLTAKYDFARFNLISSSSYSEQWAQVDQEGTAALQLFPLFFAGAAAPSDTVLPNAAHTTTTTYNVTQEVRFATKEAINGFDLVAGAFYSKSHSPNFFDWTADHYNEVFADNDPTSPLYAPGNNIYGNSDVQDEHQTAEFGELTYHFTDSLRLTGGVRHYDVANEHILTQDGLFNGNMTNSQVTGSGVKGFVYKGNVSYQLMPDELIYAQFAEGFRPGFGNTPLPPECGFGGGAPEVQPDSIKSYEVGAKTAWLDRRMTVNATAYRINWSGIQQGIGLQCGYGTSSNFGGATINGGDLETNYQLTSELSGGLTAAYISAKLRDDAPLLGAFRGDQIEFVPNWQYSIHLEASVPVLQSNHGFARLDYQYTGHSYSNYNRLSDGSRDPASELQVVRLLNARIGYRTRQWEFALSGTNLLDSVVRQSLDPWAFVTLPIGGRPRYSITRPRQLVLSARFQF